MHALKYNGDIAQYLTELTALNEDVQWSGTTFQTHICQSLPNDIIKMVYSRQGGIPETDEDFLAAVQESGLIYENMLSNPGLSGKGGPDSIQGRSKSGQPDRHSRPGSDPSSKTPRGPPSGSTSMAPQGEKKWSSNKEALKDIEQKDIDQRKKDRRACWRCGRDNHQTLGCFAKKDVNGKTLPQPPGRTASTTLTMTTRPKRRADNDGDSREAKKARTAALTTAEILEATPEQFRESLFEEVEDTDDDM
jgi:hypothetical protein